MKRLPCFQFYRNKYGDELLIDVVPLSMAKQFLKKQKAHTLSYYDITLITEGKGSFSIDGNSIHTKPGEIIFTRPGEVREWDTQHITQGYALIFQEEFLLSFFNDPHFIENLSYFKSARQEFRLFLPENIYKKMLSLFKEIQTEISANQEKDIHMLRAILYKTLMLLNRFYNIQPDTGSKEKPISHYITRFTGLINKFYKKYHEVSFYADKLCITPNHLNEVVRNSTGINAKVYITNKLLLEAKRLLIYTDISITEIAENLGYENSSYFIRIFRNHTGCTPYTIQKVILYECR